MEIIIYLLLGYLGMIINFLKIVKKDFKEESWKNVKFYYKSHPITTVITFLVVTALILSLYFESNQLTYITSLTIGISGDAVLNRYSPIKDEGGYYEP